MLGSTSLDDYSSICNIIEEKKIELYTDTLYEFSITKFKDELEEIFCVSDITPYHLQHEKIGPRIIEAYRTLRLKKSRIDCYNKLLMVYARSPFREFESSLRVVICFDEDDIQLILKQYIPNFLFCKLTSGNYINKDIAKAVYPQGDHEGTLKIEHYDITKKTKNSI